MTQVKVFFTVDVEVWPGNWTDIDRRFPEAFRQYVYGDGAYGLPHKVQVLRDHGLTGVFFVEPIFSARFGIEPLAEIVEIIKSAGQEVQLHAHAEWLDEAREAIVPIPPQTKVQHLSYLNLADQTAVLRWAKTRVESAGADPIEAFRAGSFACNRDTLRALAASGIYLDSSYTDVFRDRAAEVRAALPATQPLTWPFVLDGVTVIPATVFRDRPGHCRPLQLTACSLREMIAVLEHAAARGDYAVVIVSHNFELLDRRTFTRDALVVRRFHGLCDYLSRHRDRFETTGFRSLPPPPLREQPPLLRGSTIGLAGRYIEQAMRRLPSRD